MTDDRRRRYRPWIVAAVVAALAVALAPPALLLFAARAARGAAASADGGVPGRVFDPWPWQAPVAQSPAGRAAVLLSGSGNGLGSTDEPWTLYGSKIAAVGRDGSYRMLRYADMYRQVGQDVRLSPDGRYVVGPDCVEDPFGQVEAAGRLSVVDLVTGRARHFTGLPADVPVAWQPDGAALLLWNRPAPPPDRDGGTAPFDGNEATYGYAGGALWLLDLATGGSRKVLDLGTAVFDPTSSVAFAPDGRHLAVQLDRTLLVVDTTDGSSRTLATLGVGQRLGGAGAFTADGTRLAVLDRDGCATGCTDAARNQRRWRLLTLDAATGRAGPDGGFDPVPGAAVRVAGWQRDGTAVVVSYQDDDDPYYAQKMSTDPPAAYRSVSAAHLLAVRPGGGTTQLIRPEGVEVSDIDVAHDLVVDGRFGGPAPEPAALPVASWVYWLLLIPTAGLLLLVALGVLVALGIRRRRIFTSNRGRVRRGV